MIQVVAEVVGDHLGDRQAARDVDDG
jgi:hypothetical protein